MKGNKGRKKTNDKEEKTKKTMENIDGNNQNIEQIVEESEAQNDSHDKMKQDDLTENTLTDKTPDEVSPQEDKVEEELKDCCKQKIAEITDRHLRLLAEFENYRRRTLKEKEEISKIAVIKVIKALLPIIDDFDRAIQNMEKNNNIDQIKEGFSLVYRKFQTMLQQQGVEPINCENADFNTDYHEAVTMVEVPEDKKNKVIQEVEKGYTLNGQVIRFAKVIVGN